MNEAAVNQPQCLNKELNLSERQGKCQYEADRINDYEGGVRAVKNRLNDVIMSIVFTWKKIWIRVRLKNHKLQNWQKKKWYGGSRTRARLADLHTLRLRDFEQIRVCTSKRLWKTKHQRWLLDQPERQTEIFIGERWKQKEIADFEAITTEE